MTDFIISTDAASLVDMIYHELWLDYTIKNLSTCIGLVLKKKKAKYIDESPSSSIGLQVTIFRAMAKWT